MSMVNQTAHNVKSSANGLEGTDMDSTDATWWTELRAEFPYLENHVFAWSGGQAPIATSVRAAIDRVMAAGTPTLSRFRSENGRCSTGPARKWPSSSAARPSESP